MVEYLLKLLENSMERIDKPAAVKAQIVKALKSMLNSMQYISQVQIHLIMLIKFQLKNLYD